MKETMFPKTLAAVERAEGGDQWAIGDALLKEIGPLSESGSNDGSRERLAECALDLQERGFDYTAKTLGTFRTIAAAFPASLRRDAVPFETHKEAGSPEMLDRAFRLAQKKLTAKEKRDGKEPTVTKRYAKAVREAVQAEEKQKREAAMEQQRAEAKRKQQEADEARQRAEQERTEKAEQEAKTKQKEADKAANLPPVPAPPVDDAEVDLRQIREQCKKLAEEAKLAAITARKLLDKHGAKFDDETLALIADTFRETGNEWTALAARYTKQPRGLEAVGAAS